MVKWIVITGGVLSGLGKGVAAASLGNLLSEKYSVIPMKCDGYLNADPGTMNPYEHGEVFVLDDGGEVDMDFGHYERFLGVTCKSEWNLTMGKVYQKVRRKERKGDYLGKTVQMIPHVTDLIKDWWKEVAKKESAEVMLLEIGGTIGDIENELYVEAARQLRADGEEVLYVHLTYVPILANVNEQKSKPTQQSVSLLRSRGIQPDIILARCEGELDPKIKNKIATFCGTNTVITASDVKNIYEIPKLFYEQGIASCLKNVGLQVSLSDDWTQLLDHAKALEKPDCPGITVAICGKYTELEDSYASVVEALKHSGCAAGTSVSIVWLDTADIDDVPDTVAQAMRDIDAVIVPGGFGSRGVEGKIQVVKYCRENNIPFLGICYGLQVAVIEHARNLGLSANSTEVDPSCADPVVKILEEQEAVIEKGGTMRLGAYDARIKEGTKLHELYGTDVVSERHRHRYEVNPAYHEQLEKNGLVFSGVSPDRKLVEFIERTDHPYFIATQAHPELKSTPIKPAPLFLGLVKAVMLRK